MLKFLIALSLLLVCPILVAIVLMVLFSGPAKYQYHHDIAEK
jgi:hypothetical protein